MRAVLAILVDSYREAAASRILWIALAAIVLLLAALTPLSLETALADSLRTRDVMNFDSFAEAFSAGRDRAGTPAAHLWSLMDNDQQKKAESWFTPDNSTDPERREVMRRRQQGDAIRQLNELVAREDFFSAEHWAGVELAEELKVEVPGEGSARDRQHRNLKRLAAAFPRNFLVSDEAVLTLAYAGIPAQIPIPIPPSQIDRIFNATVIFVLSTFLGFFGIFSSLLVTASLIPRTFEPGEISLLLSKPVRRSVLFATKFFGGCAFTLFCATLLVSGVVFLLWLRFDRWRPELLWCIPLYVFLFAIYFSVSALAGAIWRNPIVSLSMVVAFWVLITMAGVVENLLGVYLQSQQVVTVTTAGEQMFVIDGQRSAARWDETTANWMPILGDSGPDSFGRVMQNIGSSGQWPTLLAPADGSSAILLNPVLTRGPGAVSMSIVTGSTDDGFEGEKQSTTPTPMFGAALSTQGDLLLAGTSGVFRFAGASEQSKKLRDFLSRRTGGLISAGASSGFESLTAADYPTFSRLASVAFNPADDSITYLDGKTLTRAVRSAEGRYSVAATRERSSATSALIATGGGLLMLVDAEGTISACQTESLEEITAGRISAGESPRAVAVAPDGSWSAVLTHGGEVVTFQSATRTFTTHSSDVTGGTAVIGFTTIGELVLSDGRRSVRLVRPDDLTVVRTLSGATGLAFQIYDYLIHPAYTILPKPSDLDNLVRWIVTGEKSLVIGNGDGDDGGSENLQQTRVQLNLWGSFWSNASFVGVMLLAGCVYLARKDF